MTAPHPIAILPLRNGESSRFDGADWVRAGGAILVVLFHAAIPYMVCPLPGLTWATQEEIGHPAIDLLGWGIDGFVMPLFFVMSGFFLAHSLDASTSQQVLKNRSRRLVSAFLIGAILILPLDFYIWIVGWVCEGYLPPSKLRSLKIEGFYEQQISGVAHLWYLQCLWAHSLVGAVLWPRVRNHMPESAWTRILACAGLIACSSLMLAWEPETLIGFRNRWFPSLAKILFYGCFLVGGLLLYEWRVTARSVARHAWILAAVGVLLFPILHARIQEHTSQPKTGGDLAMLTTLFVTFSWFLSAGLFVHFTLADRKTPALVRFLSDASIWIYLAHHPACVLAQVDMLQTDLPLPLRFAIAAVLGIGFPLLTFGLFVRRTSLGRWLGVIKKTSLDPTSPAHSPRELPERKAA